MQLIISMDGKYIKLKAVRKVQNTVACKLIVFSPIKNFPTFFVAEHGWIHMTQLEGNLPHVFDTWGKSLSGKVDQTIIKTW